MPAMITKPTVRKVLTLFLYVGPIISWLEFFAFDPLRLVIPACGMETSSNILNLTFSPSCSSQRSIALSHFRSLAYLLAVITSIIYTDKTANRKAKKKFPGPGRRGELRIIIPPKSPFIREAQFLNEMAKQEMIELDALFESFVGSPIKVSLPSSAQSEFSMLISPTSISDQNTIDWQQTSPDKGPSHDDFSGERIGHLQTDEDGIDFQSALSGHVLAPESVVNADADAEDTDIWWQLFFEEHGSSRLCNSPTSCSSLGSEHPLAAGQILERNVGKVSESDFDFADFSGSIDRRVVEWIDNTSGDEGSFWDEM